MTNRYELIALWLGAGKAGCSSALINTNSTGKTLLHALQVSYNQNNSKTKQVVIFDQEIHSKLSTSDIDNIRNDNIEIYIWETLLATQISTLPSSRLSKEYRRHITEKDVLLYIFTSGTTGKLVSYF